MSLNIIEVSIDSKLIIIRHIFKHIKRIYNCNRHLQIDKIPKLSLDNNKYGHIIKILIIIDSRFGA